MSHLCTAKYTHSKGPHVNSGYSYLRFKGMGQTLHPDLFFYILAFILEVLQHWSSAPALLCQSRHGLFIVPTAPAVFRMLCGLQGCAIWRIQTLLALCPCKTFTAFLPFTAATVMGLEGLFPISHGFTCDDNSVVLMVLSGNWRNNYNPHGCS